MLAKLRIRGFYLIAGVPNTTHVTQATDRNYGLFKSIYRVNLQKLTDYRAEKKEDKAKRPAADRATDRVRKKTTIRPTDIPLLIFGGLVGDGDDDEIIDIGLQNAFEEAFGFETNKRVWKDIGIIPFNRKCLQDDKVKHELVVLADGTIDLDADPLTETLLSIERSNKNAVDFLNKLGFDGEQFRKCAPSVAIAKLNTAVTVPQTRERQNVLLKATSAGDRFRATGGGHIGLDDWFIGKERERRDATVLKLSERKKKWEESKVRESEAKCVIDKLKIEKSKDVYKDEDAKSLSVLNLKILYRWKHGKSPPSGPESNKPALLSTWQRTKDKDDTITPWSEVEESQLVCLQSKSNGIHDTEVSL